MIYCLVEWIKNLWRTKPPEENVQGKQRKEPILVRGKTTADNEEAGERSDSKDKDVSEPERSCNVSKPEVVKRNVGKSILNIRDGFVKSPEKDEKKWSPDTVLTSKDKYEISRRPEGNSKAVSL